ncbi:hypothetical protein MPTK1_8g12300 [Marchantia polymorpha subsp. ruderalis]|uniref:Uncharacterized protein n=1 Tax=Marchantia polymorpha TaxID=3197 RepID=A0A2R6WJW1_MARPO|nr:hypothetical protein MARPO_0083s0090 [Marchantia polymorpha]BBN19635.1 hypothetical protein Mp_8g12300 [Marchantia polymorpha subsp. ruderalis]|eukprot:PTQ34132.1 hypothetical protein MARPO_0083s0090 [Marchantia polymorpha]
MVSATAKKLNPSQLHSMPWLWHAMPQPNPTQPVLEKTDQTMSMSMEPNAQTISRQLNCLPRLPAKTE